MRVMQVVHAFPPDAIAGVERYTQRLAAELARSGDTLSVVTRRTSSAGWPEMLRERLPDGTTIYRFTGGNAHGGHFLRHHDRLEELFRAALAEAAPEVVHFNHLSRLSPRFLQMARRYGAGVVATLHDYFFACALTHLTKTGGELCRGPDGGRECAHTCFAHEGDRALLRWGVRTTYFRRLLSLVHRIIAPSRYLASFFENFHDGPERIQVIPNGVPVEALGNATHSARTPAASGMLRLAFLGMVIPHKGVHVILDALKIANLARVELVVFGRDPDADGDYSRCLCRQAETIPGLRFRLHGSYESRDLDALLADVDCVLVPSLVPENYPLVTQEALCRGIPVIASRLGGIPEIVKEDVNGCTFDHRRPGELAAIFRRLVDEENLLERLREGARNSSVLSMPRYAELVRGVYTEALKDADRTRPDRLDLEELAFLHNALLKLGVG